VCGQQECLEKVKTTLCALSHPVFTSCFHNFVSHLCFTSLFHIFVFTSLFSYLSFSCFLSHVVSFTFFLTPSFTLFCFLFFLIYILLLTGRCFLQKDTKVWSSVWRCLFCFVLFCFYNNYKDVLVNKVCCFCCVPFASFLFLTLFPPQFVLLVCTRRVTIPPKQFTELISALFAGLKTWPGTPLE
jgi:hypothetical protein